MNVKRFVHVSMWHRMSLLGLAAATVVAVGATLAVADVISTFDSGWDGWTGNAGPHPGVLETWQASGGNPGGYIDFVDQDSGDGAISAPAKFLGNWSSLDGVGQLRWDSIVFSPGTLPWDFTGSPWVIISGPGGTAEWAPPGYDNTQWVTYTAPISSDAWTMSSGAWSSLLADVTSLVIEVERTGNGGLPGDHDGLDNVILSTTPEPTSLIALSGLGAMGLIACVGRRRAKA